MTDDTTITVAEPVVGEAEERQLLDVLHSGRYVQGKYVEQFERKWTNICGVRNTVAVTNGTAAIHLVLEALGIGKGDIVAVPAMSFGATAEAVYHADATPVFVDVTEGTHTMDPEDLAQVAAEHDVTAAIPVHLYGHPADMEAISRIAANEEFEIVEDAAQAHGATINGKPVGGFGRAGCFSFYATKNVTAGEGGAITTDDDDLAECLRSLRNHGMNGRDTHDVLGWNYRMSEFHGAVGAAQVEKLERFNNIRETFSRRLRRELRHVEWLEPLDCKENVTHAWFWAPFVTQMDGEYLDGKAIHSRLNDNGLETRHRYVQPLQEQAAFNVPDKRPLPVAERVSGNVIGLPNHPGLTDDDLEEVVSRITAMEILPQNVSTR